MDRSPRSSSVHDIFQARLRSGLPFPPPGDLPDPRIEPVSPALAGGFFTTEPPGKLSRYIVHYIKTKDYIIAGAQMKEIDFLLSIRCRVCNRCWPFFFSRHDFVYQWQSMNIFTFINIFKDAGSRFCEINNPVLRRPYWSYSPGFSSLIFLTRLSSFLFSKFILKNKINLF